MLKSIDDRAGTGSRGSEMVESLLAMWAAGGERAEDLDQFRQDKALALLLGHDLPAAQTARDFLAQFHAEDLPLLQEGKAPVAAETVPLLGLAKANAELVLDLQCRRPVKTATLDVDATVIHCDKRAAKRSYDGNRGYQPVLALWAEQDVMRASALDRARTAHCRRADRSCRCRRAAPRAPSRPPGGCPIRPEHYRRGTHRRRSRPVRPTAPAPAGTRDCRRKSVWRRACRSGSQWRRRPGLPSSPADGIADRGRVRHWPWPNPTAAPSRRRPAPCPPAATAGPRHGIAPESRAPSAPPASRGPAAAPAPCPGETDRDPRRVHRPPPTWPTGFRPSPRRSDPACGSSA